MDKDSLKKEADRLFSLRIRERDGCCLKCGDEDILDPHHIVSRTYKRLRFDEHNAVLLCRRCHNWAHSHSLDFRQWIADTYPEISTYIITHKFEYVSFDKPYLNRIIKELKVAEFKPIKESDLFYDM